MTADIAVKKAAYGVINNEAKVVVGTKYSHVGSSRTGLASYMDKGIIDHNLEQRQKNYGNGGYAFQMLNKDGDVDPDATLNIGGRVHKARSDGSFWVVDQAMLDLAEAEEKERKEYIKGIVKKCLISDEICAKVIGMNETLLMSWLEPKGVPVAIAKQIGLSDSVNEYDARPSYLDVLDESNTYFAGGLHKLHKIVNAFVPVVEQATPASIQHKGEE